MWEFPDLDSMKKIEKLIDKNIVKYVKTLAPKTVKFTGAVTQDFGKHRLKIKNLFNSPKMITNIH